jgi:hypothetical protein
VQQLFKPVDGVIIDAREHVGEPGLRVDFVEPRYLDQRVYHSGALAAAVGSGEQPCLQRPLGGVVGEADATVGQEAREGVPALEYLIHCFADVAVARKLGALCSHPGLELRNERRDLHAAHREAFLDRAAVDLALDIEDCIDALDYLDRERRQHRQRPAGLGGDIGKLEQLAATVCLMSSST